ncbi:phage tail tube protein [Castellaniella denitrificans]|uniref:Phage tail tube protein n=1 Tax=Castellaniella denitrificans TaxID=56119 RepID=A0ABT4M701_9BURK|nr:phage tail tube protein [Castellaniella denitrificans]MCZ4331105.1 phage tail tube protein [Castellaniella denitrificans]
MAGETLPDGARLFLGTALATEVSITAITNANPAVASAVAHGYTDGDYIAMTSPWAQLDGMILRVEGSTTDAFDLGGFDTTNTTNFPAATNTAKAKKVTTWLEIPKITQPAMDGGDQQFYQFQYLAERIQRQIPTVKNAKKLSMRTTDDGGDTDIFKALVAADASLTPQAIKLVLANGSEIVYMMYVGFDKHPSLDQGQMMTNPLVLTMAAPDFMRYKPLV